MFTILLSLMMPLLYSLGLITVKFRNSYVYCDNSSRNVYFASSERYDISSHLIYKKLVYNTFFHVPRKLYTAIRFSMKYICVFVLFCPILLLYPVSRLNKILNNVWWNVMLNSLNFSGPVFIKLGQWASTRRDLFPSEMCDKLSILQHHTSSHSWSFTARQLKESFGEEWKEIFVFENSVPVGSGCVAQVYKAKMKCENIPENILKKIELSTFPDIRNSMLDFLKEYFLNRNNKKNFRKDKKLISVAIKVLHPNIYKRFREDLMIFRNIAQLIELIFPFLKWLDLNGCIQEFSRFMIDQMDLEQEGKMLEKFSKNFKGITSVKFPQPIWPYVRKEVLVETWEEGEPISKFISDQNQSNINVKLKQQLAELGANVILKMIFNDNLVHSDLHPGNILVQNSIIYKQAKLMTKVKDSLKIIILDCGLTSSLNQLDFVKFCKVFKAVALGKGDEVGDTFLKFSIHECKEPEKFKAQMSEIVKKARENTISLKTINIGQLLNSVFTLLTSHHVKLESNFLSIMIAIMIVEGMGRSLDPDLDILQEAANYLL